MLKVGEKTTIKVVARCYWNNTALHVTGGQHYQFVAPGTWTDLLVQRDADGYPTPWWSPLQRIAQGFRRLPKENWFVLVGAVRAEEDNRYFVVGQRPRGPDAGNWATGVLRQRRAGLLLE
jgi:hypothetical protein